MTLPGRFKAVGIGVTAILVIAARTILGVMFPEWLLGLAPEGALPITLRVLVWSLGGAIACFGLWRARTRLLEAGGTPRVPELPQLWFMGLCVGMALALPDRTHFLGDAMLRSGAVARGLLLQHFPQSLPGDVFLHQDVPRTLAATGLGLWPAQRVIGACEAFLLGWSALKIARAVSLPRSPDLLLMVPLVAQGTFVMTTAMGKGCTEVALAGMAMFAMGIEQSRIGRKSAGPELALLAALAMHRSALALLPMYLLLRFDREGRDGSSDRRSRMIPFAQLLLLIGGFCLLPRYAATIAGFDVPHHLTSGRLNLLQTTLLRFSTPLWWLDRFNAVALVAPAAGLLLLGPFAARVSAREQRLALSSIIAAVGIILTIEPQQGSFRDLDVFVPSGALITCVAVWLLGFVSESASGRLLRSAVLANSVMTILGYLLVMTIPAFGLTRIERIAQGPPHRDPSVRAQLWETLGDRYTLDGDNAAALGAYRRALREVPSPRREMSALVTAAAVRDPEVLQSTSRLLLARDSLNIIGLLGMAKAAEYSSGARPASPARARLDSVLHASSRARAQWAATLSAFPALTPSDTTMPAAIRASRKAPRARGIAAGPRAVSPARPATARARACA